MSVTSKRKLNIIINGNPYLIEVGNLHTSPIGVTVNGQLYQVELDEIDVGSSSGRGTETAVASGTDLEPTLPNPGAVHAITKPATYRHQVGELKKTIAAPMPGNIVEINVKPGDQICPGQELCALEAMKMKNVIRSSLAGELATIEVTKGQAVAHGDVLFTFV